MPARRWIVGIAIVALAARVVLALVLSPPIVADGAGYEASALRLATTGTYAFPAWDSDAWTITEDGHTITDEGYQRFLEQEPDAWLTPGYTLLLAPGAALLGRGAALELAVRIAQALISILTATLVYRTARRFGDVAATVALLAVALYPPMALAPLYLVTETVYSLAVVASVLATIRWTERPTWGRAAAIGLTFGLGLLIKPTFALWAPVAMAIILWRGGMKASTVIGHLLIAGLVASLVMAPWWVRNYERFDRFVMFGTWGAATSLDGIRADAAGERYLPWEDLGDASVPTDPALVARIAQLDGSGLTGEAYASAASDLVAAEWRDRFWPTLGRRVRSSVSAAIQPFAVPGELYGGAPFWAATLAHWALLTGYLAALWQAALGRRLRSGGEVGTLAFWLVASVPLYFIGVSSAVFPQTRYAFPGAWGLAVTAGVLAALILERRHVGGAGAGTRTT